MTPDETSTLLGFLIGGLTVGMVANWVDQIVAYWKGRP